MELKLFCNLIGAIGKVAGRLKADVNQPRPEREAVRYSVNNTYRLIAATINMAITRLDDFLRRAVPRLAR